MSQTISLTLNGSSRHFAISLGETLLEVLRRESLKSVKLGCDTGDCGACAVLVDGRAVNACMVLAVATAGCSVTTVEGLEQDGRLHRLQEALLDAGGVQCGFCSPGMVVAAVDLLSRNPHPTEAEVREGLAGNLCRCTGYVKPVDAILAASAAAEEARP
ncbi:MAG: (2Fe-2S)-binding protein [Acidimicrobiia bacterium]|nr:(2Fe-2S)-binding protein [Acidimicrobiia bacterium]MDX2465993.1 (2Fe-2S)-binding protein [Acidimicrobiia bacterium]